MNVELASPDDFIPPVPGWRERSSFIARYGPVDFFHYDFYAQALAKIERGHVTDLQDAREMIRRALIAPGILARCFDAIVLELVRYPAVEADAFRANVDGFIDTVGDVHGPRRGAGTGRPRCDGAGRAEHRGAARRGRRPPATGARHRGAGGRASVAPSGAGTLSRHRTGPSRRCPLPAPCPDPATGELRARARTPSFLRVAPPRAGLGFDDAPMITLHHRRTPCGLRRRQQAHRPCSAHRRRGSASRTSSPVSADRTYTSSPPFPSGSPRWQRDRVHRDGTGAVGPATPRRCAGKPGMRDAG